MQKPCTSGRTPLMSAAEYGHAKVVKLLIQAGADLRMITTEGRTALHLAAANSHAEVRPCMQPHATEVFELRL